MTKIRHQIWLVFAVLLTLILPGCSDSSRPSESTSANAVLFDPTTGTVPLPNILATATAPDPITQYRDAAGVVGLRPAQTPMDPLEALSYVNRYEVGGTQAVSGVNAPIYIRFARALNPATVNALNIKVFQIAPDSSSPSATENNRLGFSDVTALFSFHYALGSSEVSLFPNFPLLPATRYLYLVTDRVKDAVTGGSVSSSVYFGALKSTTPLTGGAFAALEPVRANTTDAGGNIILSGYAKTMDDLIAAAATSTVASRNQIAVIGRFITTAAGFVARDPAQPVASLIPVETALRAFAAGSGLPGGLSGKDWLGSGQNLVTVTTPAGLTPQAYFAQVTGGALAAPASVGAVVTGSFPSADISMNAVAAHNNPAMNLGVAFGTYSASTAVVQPFRAPGTGALTGFYYSDRQIPFVYIAPAGAAPAGGWPTVIFQHGINRSKEDVVAVAGSLTAAGYAVVAIDLPLHGELAFPGHTSETQWGIDFVSLGAPLATRANIEQAAFNLHRLELVLATPSFNPAFAALGFAPLGAQAPNPLVKPKYVSMSLGSIVGAYYLAGNTTLDTTPGVPPYTQASLNADMKGLLSVPGGRLAYLLKDSPDFGPAIAAGLVSRGIAIGSPTYQQFFLLTQSVVDPVDPATMTTPLPNLQTGAPLPSRLSGRLLVQEATTTAVAAFTGIPTNGDLVIPNANTRYFGNALGGRGVLGFDVAPGFSQLSDAVGHLPALFMLNRAAGGALVPKVTRAANSSSAAGPVEGYYQFDQSDVSHGFLIDQAGSPQSFQLAQRQMVVYVTSGVVVDPALVLPPPKPTLPQALGVDWRLQPPAVWTIFGKPR